MSQLDMGATRHLRDDAHRLVRVELELERRVRRPVEVAVALAVRVEVAAVLVADALEAVAGVAGRLAVVVAAVDPGAREVALGRCSEKGGGMSCVCV